MIIYYIQVLFDFLPNEVLKSSKLVSKPHGFSVLAHLCPINGH